MLYSETGSYSGYGFAIPTTIMTKVVDDLKAYGTVQRAVLGVTGGDVSNYLDSEKAKGNTPDLGTLTGIWVNSISENSAAAEIGLQQGDVIIQINDKVVHKMSEMQELLAQYRPGDKISVTWLRNKNKHTKTVTLKNNQGSTKLMQEIDLDEMGVVLEALSSEEKSRLGIPYGLVVKSIRSGKMQKAGISKGTIIIAVNDIIMNTTDNWEQALKAANQSPDRTLWIKAIAPSGRKQSFVIELNED
jgi:S1-C subfamily serine protease